MVMRYRLQKRDLDLRHYYLAPVPQSLNEPGRDGRKRLERLERI